MNIYCIRHKKTGKYHMGGSSISLGEMGEGRHMPFFKTDLKSAITQARRAISVHNSNVDRYSYYSTKPKYSRSEFEVVAIELDPFKSFDVEETNITKNTPVEIAKPTNDKTTVVFNIEK